MSFWSFTRCFYRHHCLIIDHRYQIRARVYVIYFDADYGATTYLALLPRAYAI